MVSEAQKRANEKYTKANRVQVPLKLNKNTDADILDWLEKQDNKSGALKKAIRAYIK